MRQLLIREFKSAVSAHQKQEHGWPIIVKAALLKMIAILFSNQLIIHSVTPLKQDNEKAMMAKAVMTYIHDNYANKLTINELANVVNMSPQYFCKFFRSMFGKTAIEHINAYRIEKACHLLKQSNDKIINIAFAVGFDNCSYFIRKFKSLKHATPSTYRKIKMN